jgi:hypothetical protein
MKLKPKHKAMRLDNGTWIEGFYVQLKNAGYVEHLIYTGLYRDNLPDFPERFDVVPESVVQI